MPENVTPAPAAPAAPPPAPAPAAPEPSRADKMIAAVAAAEAAPPAAPEPAKPATPPVAPEPAPAEPAQLTKIAKQMAEFRKEREQVEPYIKALQVLSPTQVQALSKALAGKDARSAIAALGFSAEQILSPPPVEPAPAEPKSALPPEISKEFEELRAFKEQYRAEQERKQQAELAQSVATIVGKNSAKFTHLAGLESYGDVLGVLSKFHAETGKMPGDTFEESVLMAAEFVEKNLQSQAEKWKKVLTPGNSQPTVPAKEAPVSPPAEQKPRTLSNALSAPSAAKTTPSSREEAIAALIADPNFVL